MKLIALNHIMRMVRNEVYKQSDLDKRICDLTPGASNKETLRRFIENSEKDFSIEQANIDAMGELELNNYIDYLDDLWCS